ncbi:MAG: prepilin-type N-terminal cleavage/methylation domain-containing protein [Betaproteobacteria bacterium]|nr:prepilin-type N-terminal cleavage/methylation domain-containing protein [Betaproteobacteria bacterium]
MKAASSRKSQTGFTLVEIAIVLVIIGLLLGGILKGQEMITQAKIKNVINDFNGIAAATSSYQDRYRALPGDELDATTVARWGATAFGGDANGVLCTGVCGATPPAYNAAAVAPALAGPEPNLFWMHLRFSGFVAGPTSGIGTAQQPANAANGILGVQTTGMGFTSTIVCSSNLPDKIAIAVDTQMDDGAATTGQLRGLVQTAPNPTAGTTAPVTPYAETGTNQYLLCKNL